MTGWAQQTFQHLTEESRGSYSRAKKALQERFNPNSRRELYAVELNTRRKRKDEAWADFAEDLWRLAYPDLQEEAREYLALNSYLSQLSDPQVSFSVKQRRPKSIVDAVAAMLELEVYTKTGPGTKAHVSGEATATVRDADEDKMVKMLDKIMQQIEWLEADRQSAGTEFRSGHRRSSERSVGTGLRSGHQRLQQDGSVICRKCGQEGHMPGDVLRPDIGDTL